MYNLAQKGYTHDEVLEMLQSDRTIDFEFDVFNKDNTMIGSLQSAKGSITFDSTCEIMGTIAVDYIEEDFLKGLAEWRLRPAFKLLSPKGWLKFNLGIYIMSTPSVRGDSGVRHCSAAGYDFCEILKEDKVTERYYVAANSLYTQVAGTLIADAGIKRINIASSDKRTPVELEWQAGTPYITIVNELLASINYEPIHFDLNGYACSKAYVAPELRPTEYVYQTNEDSLIFEGTSILKDTFNKPNVFVRYTKNPDGVELKAEYVNNAISSPISVVNRGRRIVDIDTVNDIADQATLNDYTKRIAIENSQVYETITLSTALMPHHFYRDCLFIEHSKLDIGNKYIEYGWSLPLEVGGTMTHTLQKAIKI